MKMFTVEIDTGNAAFDDTLATEVARLLREAARRVQMEGDGLLGQPAWLYDANGNRVGHFVLREE